jgi:hypothetical protein
LELFPLEMALPSDKEYYNGLHEKLCQNKNKSAFYPGCDPVAVVHFKYNLGENAPTTGAFAVVRFTKSTDMPDERRTVPTVLEALRIVELDQSDEGYFLEKAAFDSNGHLLATNRCVPLPPSNNGGTDDYVLTGGGDYDTSFHVWRKIFP